MNYEEIALNAIDAADKLHSDNKAPARKQGCRIFSRGFEFLSLDAKGERDEQVVDYCDRNEMTAEMVKEQAEDCIRSGSAFLAIGYGVDASESQEYYDAGDYEPMYDWIDLDNVPLAAPAPDCFMCPAKAEYVVHGHDVCETCAGEIA